jgi:hypothetical protein
VRKGADGEEKFRRVRPDRVVHPLACGSVAAPAGREFGRAFIAECRKALAAPVVESPQQVKTHAIDDDVDAYFAEEPAGDEEETDDEEYYADAFGNS